MVLPQSFAISGGLPGSGYSYLNYGAGGGGGSRASQPARVSQPEAAAVLCYRCPPSTRTPRTSLGSHTSGLSTTITPRSLKLLSKQS